MRKIILSVLVTTALPAAIGAAVQSTSVGKSDQGTIVCSASPCAPPDAIDRLLASNDQPDTSTVDPSFAPPDQLDRLREADNG